MTRVTYHLILTVVILTGLIIMAGCGAASQETPQSPGTEAPETSPGLPVSPSGTTSSPTSVTIELEIANFAFSPETITVAMGTTVTWYNNDSAPHTVTTREPLFNSGRLSRNETFSYVFEQRGTFEYYCSIHPYMAGKVIVE